MDITQQHALDAYRAARHSVPAPPAPDKQDWRTVRELWEAHQESTAYGTSTRPAGRTGARTVLRRLAATLHRISARKRPVDDPGSAEGR